jgi:hypothetical protein
LVDDQSSGGPPGGHCLSSPDSRDNPVRSGPRHCGQSPDPDGADWPETATTNAAASANEANPVRLIKLSMRASNA